MSQLTVDLQHEQARVGVLIFMKRTALQVVKDILTQLNASACYVVEYRAKNLDGDGDYESTKEPVMVPLAELENYVAAKNNPNSELGICSKFIVASGIERHLVFVDCDDKESLPWMGTKLDTTRGRHIYMTAHRESIATASAKILEEFDECVDLKWLQAGLAQGFHILRLTANAERFNKQVPTEL